MSRVLLLKLTMQEAQAHCDRMKIGVSALEPLVTGGVRLVCMSISGAEEARAKLSSKLIKGEVVRVSHRPVRWRA